MNARPGDLSDYYAYRSSIHGDPLSTKLAGPSMDTNNNKNILSGGDSERRDPYLNLTQFFLKALDAGRELLPREVD